MTPHSNSPPRSAPRPAPTCLRIPRALAPVLSATAFGFGLWLGLAAVADAAERGKADEQAAAVAARTVTAMGGEAAWDATRFVRFDFAGRRSHWWDKHTGRHRMEGTDREGRHYVVLQNVVEREGRAWRDGSELSGDEAAGMLENAYGAWINDTYWLAAPYKLRDPGVNLSYEREETVDGKLCDVLLLSFGEVGLTPGDRYWMYVDRESGLVTRWSYVLEHQEADAEPTVWRWEGWGRYGDVQLATDRYREGDDRLLGLAPIAIFDELPDELFTSPEPVPVELGGAEPDAGGDEESR